MFNKKTWIRSTRNKNALALSQLFGSISKTEYVPVLAYQIKSMVEELKKNGTPLSDSTVRRTIKKLIFSGHLFALKNTNLSGRQKIYIAIFPIQENDDDSKTVKAIKLWKNRLDAFDIAIDALQRFRRNFDSLEAFILTGRNVHFDRLKRSKRPFRMVLPIMYKKPIIKLVGSDVGPPNKIQKDSKPLRKPTRKGEQLTLINPNETPAPKRTEGGKRLDTREKCAARASSHPIAGRKSKVEIVLNTLNFPRVNEIREAWSIYFDDAAAGELKSKVARMRLKFPLKAISKMLIDDGWIHHEFDPASVEQSERLERWQARAADIRAAKSTLENAKKQQNAKWNEYTNNAKIELYKVQGHICDAEDELMNIENLAKDVTRVNVPTLMSEIPPAVLQNDRDPVQGVVFERESPVLLAEGIQFDIRAALSQLKMKGTFDE